MLNSTKFFFFKKKLRQLLVSIGGALLFIVLKIWQFCTAKRTLLFVSNDKIRSITLGPIPQISFFLLVAWGLKSSQQFFYHNSIIRQKTEEIEKLRTANEHFSQEFQELNDKISKIDRYFLTISGEKNLKNASNSDSELEKARSLESSLDKDIIDGKDLHTLKQIRDSNLKIAGVSESISLRIKKIESALETTGLSIAKPLIAKNVSNKSNSPIPRISGQKNSAIGGPISEITDLDISLLKKLKKYSSFPNLQSSVSQFENRIEYLASLEKIVAKLPFDKPIRSFYLSSGFGIRRDPITGSHHPHYGLDFVGAKGSKIISPAPGKVILAHWFSEYGNAVVIDHGNGITTRYGHLSKINVSEGQRVKRGEIIAVQGNTGRSTGAHLHYEVRYKNRPLNPKNFIRAGEIIKNKKLDYVNS